jgi:hypothetical protein
MLGVGPHRVSHVLKDFTNTGIVPEPLPRGPRRKVTKAILSFIDIRTLQQAHLSSAQLTAEICGRFHVHLDPSTIAYKRRQLNFRYQPPRHTQELHRRHIDERVAFCQKLLANPGWLPKIHFSDESRFVLGDDRRWVWYRRGEQNPSAMRDTQKFPRSVMIFGVIGPDYKSRLLFVEGTIDAERYIRNLSDLGFIEELDHKHGALEWIFQQDGAPCHTSQKAVDWIEENCDLLSEWPANSPDLNPIELVWALLKHSVAAIGPETIEELKQVIQQTWDTISIGVINKLCSGFARRLSLCLEAEGRSISKLLHLCGAESAADSWRVENQIHGEWTVAEDRMIYEVVRTLGTRWLHLERLLPGRSGHAIKNRWYAVLQKREHALLGDTTIMMDIRRRLENGQDIAEICGMMRN